jgi:predicted TIM-barrel fold metal-dependent hydrolase
MFWSFEPDEPQLGATIEGFDPQAIIFASDYPHWDCTFSGVANAITGRADIEHDAKIALLRENARALYNLEVASKREIVGSIRDE